MPQSLIPFPSRHFTLERLADGVYAAIATNGGSAISNAGIVDLGDRTLVFDTFMTPQAGRDLRLAAQLVTGRDPALVVNSHYHNDHIWGNQSFGPETLFLCTSRTLDLMHASGRDELKWAQDVSAGRFSDARHQHETARDELSRRESQLWMGYYGGLVEALPSLSVRFPAMTFDGPLAIHGSARTVELIPFDNSHTGSDLILLLRSSGIAFMADLLFVGCHPYLDEAVIPDLMDSLHRISDLGAAVFVPGHGPLGTPQDVVADIAYVSMCTETARRLVAQGDTSPEAIAHETPPKPFDQWGLSRFFRANLESLCARLKADKPVQ